MKKIVKLIVLLLAACVFLCSCVNEKKSCEELLRVGLEYGIDAYYDNGCLFLKTAEEGEVFFFTQKAKKTMYGEKFLNALDATEDFAIYVSASSPYEMAVFKCYSRNDVDGILRMCYERADALKVGLRFGKWERASKDVLITAHKKYVVFIFTDSSERNQAVYGEIIAALR